MCDYCSDLRPTVRIRVPKKLSQMLLRASDRLADGTLIDITPAYAKVYGPSLDFAKTLPIAVTLPILILRVIVTYMVGTISWYIIFNVRTAMPFSGLVPKPTMVVVANGKCWKRHRYAMKILKRNRFHSYM